jgi:hypothetical protein
MPDEAETIISSSQVTRMTSAEKSLPELLRTVRAELDAATQVDTVSLARPRAKLAWIASLLSARNEDARSVLGFASEVASAIGLVEAEIDADRTRLNATRMAVSAVGEYLDDPDNAGKRVQIVQAGHQLLTSIGRDPAEWMWGAPGVAAA